MKRWILCLSLILMVVLVPAVEAQTTLSFETVRVQFWPEYDRPSMLVIFTMEMAADQALPVEMTVRIPARAGDPTAVAVLEGTQLVTRDYTRIENGEWAEITLLTESPVIQIEYYDPLLSQQDQPRNFQFDWDFDYPINELIVSVKQPPNASGVQITPSLGAGLQGADGLLAYDASLGNLPSGDTLSFSLSYEKSDKVLAIEQIASPPAEVQSQPVATNPLSGAVPDWGWALIGAGVILLVGGGAFLLRSNRSAQVSRYRQKKQRTPVGKSTGVFCHQCGQAARAGDKFCRECGTKLRL